MQKRFVVVGSGYAGTLAALRLARRVGQAGTVTLIDPELALVERVRLHEAVVHGREVAHPLDPIVDGTGISLVRGRVVGLGDHFVALDDASRVAFDRCIVATGSKMARTTPGAAEHTMALEPRTVPAVREALAHARRVVVLGAGLTGIEVASEIAESMPSVRVTLVTRTLGPSLRPRARAYVASALRRLGVELFVGVGIDRVEHGVAHFGERSAPFDLAIDTTGFVSEAPAFLTGARDAAGRLIVDAALRVHGHQDVILAGDLAAPEGALAGTPMIRGCQSAMPMGAHAADVAIASVAGRPVRAFAFMPNGYCVSLGRRDGVVDTSFGALFTGRIAAWIKERIVRYTMWTMHAQARGWDYRWRPFFGASRMALPAPARPALLEGAA